MLFQPLCSVGAAEPIIRASRRRSFSSAPTTAPLASRDAPLAGVPSSPITPAGALCSILQRTASRAEPLASGCACSGGGGRSESPGTRRRGWRGRDVRLPVFECFPPRPRLRAPRRYRAPLQRGREVQPRLVHARRLRGGDPTPVAWGGKMSYDSVEIRRRCALRVGACVVLVAGWTMGKRGGGCGEVAGSPAAVSSCAKTASHNCRNVCYHDDEVLRDPHRGGG
jgi:hypothetical protein